VRAEKFRIRSPGFLRSPTVFTQVGAGPMPSPEAQIVPYPG